MAWHNLAEKDCQYQCTIDVKVNDNLSFPSLFRAGRERAEEAV